MLEDTPARGPGLRLISSCFLSGDRLRPWWDLVSQLPVSRGLFVRRTPTESPITHSRAVKGAAQRRRCAANARIDKFLYEGLDAREYDVLDHDREHNRNEDADNDCRD